MGDELIFGTSALFALYAAFGVGASMLAMANSDIEHPLAVGTALGAIAHGFDWALFIFVSTPILVMVAVD